MNTLVREDIETIINEVKNLSIISQTSSVQRDRFLRRYDVVHDKGTGVFGAADDLRLIAEMYGVEPVSQNSAGNTEFLKPDGTPADMTRYKTSPNFIWVEEIGVNIAIPQIELRTDVPTHTKRLFAFARATRPPPIRQAEYFMETIVFMHPSYEQYSAWRNKDGHTDPVIAHLETAYCRPFWHAEPVGCD